MKNRPIADLFLYRWRYVLGYSLLAVLYVGAILVAGLYAPGGLAQTEIDALANTNQLDLSNPVSLAIPNVIFHLLQLASLSLFGVSTLAIKLPAIILSIVSAAALFFLLRRWFRSNTAVLSLLLMTTTGQFIFLGQNATPYILYVTWTALILLFASLIVQRANHAQIWKIGLAISVALSLYTPYFWYINLGLLIGALIHPHTRHFLLARKYRISWLPSIVVGMVLISPLLALMIVSPSLVSGLLGIAHFDWNILSNLKLLLKTYFWPEPFVVNGQLMPIVSLGGLMLIVLGFARTIEQRETARAYMIGSWLLLSFPLLIVQPSLSVIITVPLFILLAVGVETLIREWYRIFPKNPYARTAGLVMIIALVGVMTLSGIDRYIHGYRSLPEVVREYNSDLPLLKRHLDNSPLVISAPHERPLYQALERHQNVALAQQFPTDHHTVLVSRAARANTVVPNNWQLTQIITNGRSEQGDRWYIYKFDDK